MNFQPHILYRRTSAQAYVTGNGDAPRTLVVIFLRGAADGLHLLPPLGDDHYYRARPTLGIRAKAAVPLLDGSFGLNNALKELRPAFAEGDLLLVPAAGINVDTRSHFEAQDLMEHGGLVGGGWLGRFLRYRGGPVPGALSAIAMADVLPECLLGAPAAVACQSMEEFSLGEESESLKKGLLPLYESLGGMLGAAGVDTIHALDRLEQLRGETYRPEQGAIYAADDFFAQSLAQAARLIKAKVGLEALSLDINGWDSHIAQDQFMEPLMRRLARGLAAFRQDLGVHMRNVSVVVMTEFGRRVAENVSLGTDHGRGGLMMVMGGGVRGGRIAGEWSTLDNERLDGPGDVPVLNQYQDVLAPVLMKHGLQDLHKVFPDHALKPLSIY